MRNLAAIVPLCLFLICALRTEADGQHASSRVSTQGASNQNCQSALPDTDHGSTGQEREQRPQVSKQLQHPENQVGAILERATNYLKHREFDKCARELSAAAKLAPQSPRVWMTYGSLNLDQGHAEEALKFFDKAKALGLKDARLLTERGVVLEILGRDREALDSYTEALAINPDYLGGLARRGAEFSRLGEWQSAIADLDRAHQMNPQDSAVLVSRGITWSGRGEFDRALDDFNKALAADSRSVGAYINRGSEYVRRDNLDAAIKDFSSAIQVERDNPEPFIRRGDAWAAKNDVAKARYDYDEAIRLAPTDPRMHERRGQFFLDTSDFKGALADFELAIRSDPKNCNLFVSRGTAHYHTGAFQKAATDFAKAIELGCNDSAAFTKLGWAYQAAKDHQKAIDSYSKAIQLSPNDHDPLIRRAALYFELQDWKNAMPDFDRLIVGDPKSPFYRYLRGSAYIQQHQLAKATADLVESIRLNPGDVGLEDERQRQTALSPAALKHGEEQLSRMLRDRPAMAEHVKRGDELWNWTVRKFAGEDIGQPVDWDPGSPRPFSGGSGAATADQHAYIRIARTRKDLPDQPPRTFDGLWATTVFELYNIKASTEWEKIDDKVRNAQIGRREYVLAVLESETHSAQYTRAFYARVYLPWLESKKLETSPVDWFCDVFPNAPGYEQMYAPDNPHSKIYEVTFDILVAERHYRQGEYEKAAALLRKVLASKDDILENQVENANYWLKLCDQHHK